MAKQISNTFKILIILDYFSISHRLCKKCLLQYSCIIKLYLLYNDKETLYFNLYKSRPLARMVARRCGRKPEYVPGENPGEDLTFPHTTSEIEPGSH